MDIVVSPNLVSLNPQSSSQTATLAPGDVVDAVVLALLQNGKARLAVANSIIDVLTKVPLEPGTTVRLAVKNTAEGIQLVIVDPGGASGKSGVALPAGTNAGVGTLPAPPASGAPAAMAGVATGDAGAKAATTAALGLDGPLPAKADGEPARAASPAVQLSVAVRAAAVRQDGLGPLFADLGEVVQSPALPAAVRDAAAQLLAMRIPLQAESADEPPTGPTGNARVAPGVGAGVAANAGSVGAGAGVKISADDMKAALSRSGLFLEARLAAAVTAAITTGAAVEAPPPNDLKAALAVFRQILKTWLGDHAEATRNGGPPNLRDAPSLVPGAPPSAGQGKDLAGALLTATRPGAPSATTDAPGHLAPPPPYRGAPTAAQPLLPPSIAPNAAPQEIGAKLLAETDAALARQTLLQAASIDRVDPQARHSDTSGPRWNFEIPLATPHGTAIAQFEIARDGRHAPPKGQSATWRARFSFDVEPAGPVHAQIALTGQRTAVTLWAERHDTAVQLRENAALLSRALTEAELDPGELTVREGAPPRPQVQAPAGRFVDRAS